MNKMISILSLFYRSVCVRHKPIENVGVAFEYLMFMEFLKCNKPWSNMWFSIHRNSNSVSKILMHFFQCTKKKIGFAFSSNSEPIDVIFSSFFLKNGNRKIQFSNCSKIEYLKINGFQMFNVCGIFIFEFKSHRVLYHHEYEIHFPARILVFVTGGNPLHFDSYLSARYMH